MEERSIIFECYIQHYSQLARIAINIVRSRDGALDVLQDVAIELLKRENELDKIKKPLPFLCTCVRHKSVDYVRKEARIQILPPNVVAAMLAEQSTIEWKQDDGEYVEQLLKNFSPQMREAFLMHVLDGYPISVLAKNLGMKPNTLSRRFMRMREKIMLESVRLEKMMQT